MGQSTVIGQEQQSRGILVQPMRGGKLYLGVACRDGSSSNRRANILVYDCVQGE